MPGEEVATLSAASGAARKYGDIVPKASGLSNATSVMLTLHCPAAELAGTTVAEEGLRLRLVELEVALEGAQSAAQGSAAERAALLAQQRQMQDQVPPQRIPCPDLTPPTMSCQDAPRNWIWGLVLRV